jgi:hypothetical protein
MNPRKLQTRQGTRSEAVSRCRIAEKYLEVAELAATEDGIAINVAVGVAVLAGIAAGDALCIVSIGERYAGQDPTAAADLLARVDASLGGHLRDLVNFKPSSHYGDSLLNQRDRTRALRAATQLVDAARRRTL